jgi:hypothetical protein
MSTVRPLFPDISGMLASMNASSAPFPLSSAKTLLSQAKLLIAQFERGELSASAESSAKVYREFLLFQGAVAKLHILVWKARVTTLISALSVLRSSLSEPIASDTRDCYVAHLQEGNSLVEEFQSERYLNLDEDVNIYYILLAARVNGAFLAARSAIPDLERLGCRLIT